MNEEKSQHGCIRWALEWDVQWVKTDLLDSNKAVSGFYVKCIFEILKLPGRLKKVP